MNTLNSPGLLAGERKRSAYTDNIAPRQQQRWFYSQHRGLVCWIL